MKRCALLLVAACTTRGDEVTTTIDDPPTVTAPTIWLEPSATVAPTALPLRDQAFITGAAQAGSVFVCDPRMFMMPDGRGSMVDGAWIHPETRTYDVTTKLFFAGNVRYPDAEFSVTTDGDDRDIAGNGLPLGVPTGAFPVAESDPAYAYDRNPNKVTAQAIAFAIPRAPAIASAPSCIYKEVGITLDGVALHGPLDSTGRDGLAHEIQDVCTGGPQPGGGYHRHALSECTPHIHDRVALVGYALDGFGIYSPYDADGRELTSADLDDCHGTTSEVDWDGRRVAMYHYVMTRDYPYTVACFRGTPTRNAFPPLPGAPPQP